jgi:hypothetical protein
MPVVGLVAVGVLDNDQLAVAPLSLPAKMTLPFAVAKMGVPVGAP